MCFFPLSYSKMYYTSTAPAASAKAREHKAYHLVKKNEINQNTSTRWISEKCTDEFKRRVVFSRKYYKGRLDRGHAQWMRSLGAHIKLNNKLNMSLDALIVLNNVRQVK